MAYSTNIDYKAIQNALKPQIDAETDATKKAALQAQYDAAQASKEQKIASDLTAFGKYATDSELDSAAGIQATNQIGTTYDTRARNISTAYDTYKQNANNDALSRGMARSSFVSDRMANLDVQRGTALSDNETARIAAIQNAKTSIIDNYRTNTANALAGEKKEFANNIMAYYNDYQAEINNVENNGDPSDDWKKPYLQAARQEKMLAQEAAALKAAKGYSGGGGGGGGKPELTAAQALEAYNGAGLRTPEVVAAYAYYYGEPPKEPTSMAINEVATDIGEMQKSGFTNSQIVANAKSAYDAGEIDYDTYQGYLRATRH